MKVFEYWIGMSIIFTIVIDYSYNSFLQHYNTFETCWICRSPHNTAVLQIGMDHRKI